MKEELYKKDKKSAADANLEDYAKTSRTFTWKDSRKYVDWIDGSLNAAYNAVDRHAQTWRKNKVALYWEDEAGNTKKYTFEELSLLSNQVGNVLKDFGVERGDRCLLYTSPSPRDS